jgi:hypothetical protein
MEGLFYNHNIQGIVWLMFYPDGRVISGDNSTKFDQFTSQWFDAKSYKVHYSRGIYQIGEGGKIRIVIKGEDFGTLVYRGTIINDDTVELSCRCPFTNYMKSATYLRFSEGNHLIHMEISNFCIN